MSCFLYTTVFMNLYEHTTVPSAILWAFHAYMVQMLIQTDSQI